jgi:hypothetical protein
LSFLLKRQIPDSTGFLDGNVAVFEESGEAAYKFLSYQEEPFTNVYNSPWKLDRVTALLP